MALINDYTISGGTDDSSTDDTEISLTEEDLGLDDDSSTDDSTDTVETTSTDTDSDRIPTGIQNPFEWQVDDGDVVAPPESSVTEEGNVGGYELVVTDDDTLDINPLGDRTVDPTDQDFDSDPDSDEGAVARDSPDTLLTSLTREVGAEQAIDEIGDQIAGVQDNPQEEFQTQVEALKNGNWQRAALLLSLLAVGAAVAYKTFGG